MALTDPVIAGRRVVADAHRAGEPDSSLPAGGSVDTRSMMSPSGVGSSAPQCSPERLGIQILKAAVDRAGAKLEYTTLGELLHVYEAVWGRPLDRANFRRKVQATQGFVAPTRERRTGVRGGAPGTVYRPGTGGVMEPPLMRDDLRL